MSNDPKFEYFMHESNKRFDKIDATLEDLKSFKLTWTGAIVVVNAIISIVLMIYFGR